MRVAALALLAALPFIGGCGGGSADVVMQSPDRLLWAAELKSPIGVAEDPQLVKRITDAANTSGARVLDVTVLSLRGGRHAPVVTLQSDEPAFYMKHDLLGFLRQSGLTSPRLGRFVELVDGEGESAWSVGHVGNTGMLHVRPELDSCSPIAHSQPVGVNYPPCPAD